MPLRSKSLAFLIENSSNQNSSQLADNKQKRPVLIENFEPNCARVFAPSHAQKIVPTAVAQPQFAALLPGLPAVFSESLPRAFFAKGSVCSNTFLPGSAQYVEIDVTYSKQSTGELLPGSRIACQGFLSRSNRASLLRVLEIEKSCANEPADEVSRSAYFLKALSKKPSDSTQTDGEFLAGARTAFMASQKRWLLALPLHLTNCSLNRLQLFPLAGVCSKWHMQEIPVRADNVGVTHSEASFVVE